LGGRDPGITRQSADHRRHGAAVVDVQPMEGAAGQSDPIALKPREAMLPRDWH
jgi:hypothetical protein